MKITTMVVTTVVLNIALTSPGTPTRAGQADLSCLPAAPEPMVTTELGLGLLQPNYPTISVNATRLAPCIVVPRDPGNLCAVHGGRRRLFVVSRDHADMLNEKLHGRQYPVLDGLMSFAVGSANALAGVLYTAFNATAAHVRYAPEVLAREGDELWRVDLAAQDHWEEKYVLITYLVLRDPNRKAQNEWVLEEDRCELSPEASQ